MMSRMATEEREATPTPEGAGAAGAQAKAALEVLLGLGTLASVPGYFHLRRYFAEMALPPHSVVLSPQEIFGKTWSLFASSIVISAVALAVVAALLYFRDRFVPCIVILLAGATVLALVSEQEARLDANTDRGENTRLRMVELMLKDCPEGFRSSNQPSNSGCKVLGRRLRETEQRLYLFLIRNDDTIDFSAVRIFKSDEYSHLVNH